jgi:oligopeptide/dipeptide ABC transporter ATP-binding protein
VPVPDPAIEPQRPEVHGEPGSLADPPGGCAFHPRCRFAIERCRVEVPLLEGDQRQQAACHRAHELDLRL